MDDNKFEGTARDLGGKAQEAAGNVTGDDKMQAEGKLNQAGGAAQKAYGQVKETVRDVGGDYGSQLLDQVEDAGDALADQIDQRPITAVLIAAGIGFLLALATKPSPKVIYRRR